MRYSYLINSGQRIFGRSVLTHLDMLGESRNNHLTLPSRDLFPVEV